MHEHYRLLNVYYWLAATRIQAEVISTNDEPVSHSQSLRDRSDMDTWTYPCLHTCSEITFAITPHDLRYMMVRMVLRWSRDLFFFCSGNPQKELASMLNVLALSKSWNRRRRHHNLLLVGNGWLHNEQKKTQNKFINICEQQNARSLRDRKWDCPKKANAAPLGWVAFFSSSLLIDTLRPVRGETFVSTCL